VTSGRQGHALWGGADPAGGDLGARGWQKGAAWGQATAAAASAGAPRYWGAYAAVHFDGAIRRGHPTTSDAQIL
jgi:hypothetical protein